MRVIRFAFVGSLALLLTSCAPSKYKDAIIGKWIATTPGKVLTLEFSTDGTAKMGDRPGTYTLDGSDNCTITLKEAVKGKSRFRTKISIEGDVMTATDADGTQITFERVKPPARKPSRTPRQT
jgi:hypothetical protein